MVADSTYNIFELVVPLHQEQEFMLYSDSEKEQTENETPKETVEIKNEKAQILVVEDNEDLLSFITTELASTYAILKAENGEEALKIIHNENIQLVISDVTMPVMDGITMCKKLKPI